MSGHNPDNELTIAELAHHDPREYGDDCPPEGVDGPDMDDSETLGQDYDEAHPHDLPDLPVLEPITRRTVTPRIPEWDDLPDRVVDAFDDVIADPDPPPAPPSPSAQREVQPGDILAHRSEGGFLHVSVAVTAGKLTKGEYPRAISMLLGPALSPESWQAQYDLIHMSLISFGDEADTIFRLPPEPAPETEAKCAWCGSTRIELRNYDYGVDPETGYHDQGALAVCLDCGRSDQL